jgi:hypothetical protein
MNGPTSLLLIQLWFAAPGSARDPFSSYPAGVASISSTVPFS